jgi:membrane protein CcdC involved in cytochrome C biogenesis
MNPQDGQTWGPVIGIGIAAVVMMIRARNGKAKPLSTVTMWIIPGLLLAGLVAMTVVSHLSALDYVWVLLALSIGAALGWQRGRMMPIHIDPETGKPLVKTSVAALVFILGLMAVRLALKQLLEGEAGAFHINPLMITDAFMALAVGLLGVARVEMFIRAQRLMAAHRAPAGIVS